jgi:hypothetical protein
MYPFNVVLLMSKKFLRAATDAKTANIADAMAAQRGLSAT